MSKYRYMQQQSIEDAMMMIDRQDSNGGENQTILFNNFLIKDLVDNIRCVPFDEIINTYLVNDGNKYRFIIKTNDIPWFCTADRRTLHSRTIFTFRFPTLSDPDSYEKFELKSNSLFMPSGGIWHEVEGWYEYTASNLSQYLYDVLSISELHNEHCRTRIFVNKQYERTDIVFNFDSTNRRIILTFEAGEPARPHQQGTSY
ncbi:unnamed protein product [Adineta steineri]|nr:unnamed protein product [Adineta steineri]